MLRRICAHTLIAQAHAVHSAPGHEHSCLQGSRGGECGSMKRGAGAKKHREGGGDKVRPTESEEEGDRESEEEGDRKSKEDGDRLP